MRMSFVKILVAFKGNPSAIFLEQNTQTAVTHIQLQWPLLLLSTELLETVV